QPIGLPRETVRLLAVMGAIAVALAHEPVELLAVLGLAQVGHVLVEGLDFLIEALALLVEPLHLLVAIAVEGSVAARVPPPTVMAGIAGAVVLRPGLRPVDEA